MSTAPTPGAAATGLPTLYRAVEAVTAERHRALRLRPALRLAAATRTGALPVAMEEMALLGRHLPLVFADAAPHVPVVLLRLADGDAPRGLAPDGTWQAGSYVPVHLRRYPFLLVPSGTAPDQLVLCLDPQAECLSSEEGEPLFDAEGKPTLLLQQAFTTARDAEAAFRRTAEFSATLGRLGLLTPSTAKVPRPGGPLQVTGFRAVDRAALGRLDGAALAALRDAGQLEAIYAHLGSIQGFAEMP
ncbi:SapC family protein [Falsiroseomonas selenitidurans]|uniref:SapC family protein n=1 Tax=Falsiroseomonas selenitidurans TaxID=2716335 RepID=A0ABX1E6M3_9PROT|nr:SapC family protein [Falsiroseomonas selenitidurans]NKC32836.1 SapC family protein [Falsiroseomonas selenitidurans]